MLITKEIQIDLGHRVPNHKSKCRNLHGHRYVIEVGVDDKLSTDKGTSSEGMVIDFADLKNIMTTELDAKFDHGFVMYQDDIFKKVFTKLRDEEGQKIIFVTFIPTVENLAKHWFQVLDIALEAIHIKLYHVKVWETPTSTAIYTKFNAYEE